MFCVEACWPLGRDTCRESVRFGMSNARESNNYADVIHLGSTEGVSQCPEAIHSYYFDDACFPIKLGEQIGRSHRSCLLSPLMN